MNDTVWTPNLYDAFAQASPMAIATTEGPEHIVRYVNPAFCLLVGKRNEELVGRLFASAAPNGYECLGLLDSVYRTGQAETHIGQQRSPSHVFYWSYCIWPLLNAAGRPTGTVMQVTETTPAHDNMTAVNEALMISSMHQHELTESSERRNVVLQAEIGEHRLAEAALSRLAAIVQSSEDAIVSKDLNGVIATWNPGAERLFGYTAQEAIGRSVKMLIPADQLDEEPRILERIRRGETVSHYETIRRRKDGALLDISLTVSPIIDEHGTIVGASKIARDITEQKHTQQLVRESEERFRSLANAIPQLAWMANADGSTFWYNDRWYEYTGTTAREMEGWGWQSVHDPEVLPTVLERWKASIARGEPLDIVFPLRGKDGRFRQFLTKVTPLRDEEGKVTRWFGTNTDITERLDLRAKEKALASERALRKTEAELARVSRALSVGELATSIAHEVNQPLAGVITNAEACVRWLNNDAPNLPEALESLALIVRDGNRASEVIRRIRTFLKKERQETAALDLQEVIEEAIALVEAGLRKREISLRTQLSDAIPRVRGDRIQLQQVILNLIMNGAEAMAAAEGSKELLVQALKSADGGVTLAVRDAGRGMPPDEMKRMFDAFFTTKPNGMGMGLSISRSIVEAHGGRIWVEANDGPGLTVSFSLPDESVSPGGGLRKPICARTSRSSL